MAIYKNRLKNFIKNNLYRGNLCCPKCNHEMVSNMGGLTGDRACPDCGWYSNHYFIKDGDLKNWEFIKENFNFLYENNNDEVYLLGKFNKEIFYKNIKVHFCITKKEIIKFLKTFSPESENIRAIIFDVDFFLKEGIQLEEDISEKLNKYVCLDGNIVLFAPKDITSGVVEYNFGVNIKFFKFESNKTSFRYNEWTLFDFLKKIKNKKDYIVHDFSFLDKYFISENFEKLISIQGNTISSILDYHNGWFLVLPYEYKEAKNEYNFLNELLKYIQLYWKIFYLLFMKRGYFEKIKENFLILKLDDFYYTLFYYSGNNNNESKIFGKSMISLLKKFFGKKNVVDMDIEFEKFKNKQNEWLNQYGERGKVQDATLFLGKEKILVEFKTSINAPESIFNDFKLKLLYRCEKQNAKYGIFIINSETNKFNIFERQKLQKHAEKSKDIKIIAFTLLEFFEVIQAIKTEQKNISESFLNDLYNR